jgi:murein DD-endopeptidase MepM/ murein hydrolase activator NlpD
LNKNLISLLSKRFVEGVALTQRIVNIKPRLEGLKRLTNIVPKLTLAVAVSLTLLGYQPVLGFPPIKQAKVEASEEQVAKIQSDVMPIVQLPHPGYLSTRFSFYHPGVDIATGLGMPVHPISEGIVIETHYDLWGLGHYVVVSHDNGLKSTYAHMGRIFVKAGDPVKLSSIIGEVGLTGNTSGPHTHLEVNKNGRNFDPLTILPPLQDFPSAEYLRPVGGEQKVDAHKSLKPDFS